MAKYSSYFNPKGPSPKHIVLNLSKLNDKEKILKVTRGKKIVTYKGKFIRLYRISQQKFYKPQKVEPNIQNTERNYQLKIMYPAKLSFKYEGEIKNFLDIQKLRKFITRKHLLQEILKGGFLPETKSKRSQIYE